MLHRHIICNMIHMKYKNLKHMKLKCGKSKEKQKKNVVKTIQGTSALWDLLKPGHL